MVGFILSIRPKEFLEGKLLKPLTFEGKSWLFIKAMLSKKPLRRKTRTRISGMNQRVSEKREKKLDILSHCNIISTNDEETEILSQTEEAKWNPEGMSFYGLR